ncbi:FAD-binding oxidoreductase [Mucilaginibacter rubeus]|uniref:FAD-binding oxidoreductase n=1 Tax=Mucilaginibacter rubeus TaxID=2027860 RepID=A0AAE6MH00_9SPHI|nr:MULTISPECIES: FAD-dependent oxidoreductase [Mucilaginibacter]QEM03036.1 FAD-binding oxidoreductase [Mucilaginibacter rubeus]QEM15655.1 FAD-binding oxidoreductase [Mucilaginibacter gossypii]QTE41611.1 FAD-binding oxidoreductase [Mucilaginibacter rubeus]QTE48216.1 FAD-binding oxidoreductase [Mucilaginibacter rubeus]QTE59605.1 FAD-binding oxidoreductase [Mucilaginibacter rubeus]
MNLYEQQPYWLIKNGIIASYPSLQKDLKLDVAIIGAGISAALTAWQLRNSGLSIAVFDKRHVGMGSTAASTAFLQYEIDTPLTSLKHLVGEANAVTSYQLCRKAIYDIADLCKSLKSAFDFSLRPSLQYASFKTHTNSLNQEYNFRKKHGFEVHWLEADEIEQKFGFKASGAIFSADGGEVDAYLLTHALLTNFGKAGHKIYSNTDIKTIEHHKQGITLQTANGSVIKAKKLIIACGYESLKYIPKKIAEINSTYALVSEPLPDVRFWYKNSLIWETAVPYMYFRAVGENRILIGGRDDLFHHPHIPPSVIKRKADMLQQAFLKKMPHIPLKADFSWAGAFAITKDGLPYIGCIPERPNTYFALGFGGNGITFSVIAAEIIHDLILESKNEHVQLFSFNR